MGYYSKWHAVLLYVYRVLLYADDFQRFSSCLPRSLSWGVYMLFLNVPPTWRTSRASVSLLSLRPPRVNSNHFVLDILEDIVDMKVKWVPAADANGEEVRIFLYVMVLIVYYPAAVLVIEFMGDNATTQCT